MGARTASESVRVGSEGMIILQTIKYKKSNEVMKEMVGKREKIEKDDWVLVYDNKSTLREGENMC